MFVDKPHKGFIGEWAIKSWGDSGHYIITGLFLDHPEFKGRMGYTSSIVNINLVTKEVETLNSRYTLRGPHRKTVTDASKSDPLLP